MSTKLKNDILKDLIKLVDIVDNSISLADVCSAYGYSNHGRNTSVVRLLLDTNDIDYSHFTNGGKAAIIEERICPQCSKSFTVRTTDKKDNSKVTCSHACGNIYFAHKQGGSNRQSGIGSYRKDIYTYYKEHNLVLCCCHCGEIDPIIIDIHHIDENRYNNELDNLVPLCVRCHRTWHKTGNSDIFNSLVIELDSRV